MGDDERQVAANAAAARAAGKKPVYLEVGGSTKPYTFTVYAQMLRTTDSLIVRAYSHLYIFPQKGVKLFYGDARTPIDLSELPAVKAWRVDRIIARGAQPGNFTQGDVGAKKRLCPDCVAFFGNLAFMRSFASRWNGIKDPWQQSPDYAPWGAPPSKSSRIAANTRITNCTRTYLYTVPGIQYLDDPLLSSHCSTTSFGSSGFSSPGGGSAGGGSAGKAPPLPAPLPPGWRMGCNTSANQKTNELNTAMTASAPQMVASMQSGNEAVNFIAQNDVSGQYAIVPGANVGTNDNGVAAIGAPPAAPAGWTIVAFTHTHPTAYLGTGDPTGIDSLAAGALPYVNQAGQNFPEFTNTLFSVPDLEYANSNHLDAYVEAYSAQNAGAAQAGTATYNYGSWNSGGVVGQTTNYSSGSMGGTSTWTQC